MVDATSTPKSQLCLPGTLLQQSLKFAGYIHDFKEHKHRRPSRPEEKCFLKHFYKTHELEKSCKHDRRRSRSRCSASPWRKPPPSPPRQALSSPVPRGRATGRIPGAGHAGSERCGRRPTPPTNGPRSQTRRAGTVSEVCRESAGTTMHGRGQPVRMPRPHLRFCAKDKAWPRVRETKPGLGCECCARCISHRACPAWSATHLSAPVYYWNKATGLTSWEKPAPRDVRAAEATGTSVSTGESEGWEKKFANFFGAIGASPEQVGTRATRPTPKV